MFEWVNANIPLWYAFVTACIAIFVTAKLVETVHVDSVVIGKALDRIARAQRSSDVVQARKRQPRHRNPYTETASRVYPYSARTICARVQAELARASIGDSETTVRLYTHPNVLSNLNTRDLNLDGWPIA